MSIIPIKVGWDYDEPVFKWYDLAHQACIEAGIALPEHEPTSWAPHETYGVTLEEWVEVLDNEVLKGEGGMYSAPIDEYTKWQLHRVHAAGHKNYIVTARGSLGDHGDRVKELTLHQIEREGLPVEDVIFSPEKGTVVRDLGLDYFIDDRPLHWQEVNAIETCEVYLLDERWNRDFRVPEGRRLNSVEEYVDIILLKHAHVGA